MTREVYLEPGDFHFGAAPLRISTILGSCVSVTLWHPQRHIGGMCHIQLPGCSAGIAAGQFDGRYAEDAFARFDLAVRRHGTQLAEYTVKLFGGGNMFPEQGMSATDVGGRNLAATRHLLNARGLRPAAEHIGGAGHRKLFFDLASGDVWLAFRNLEPEKDTTIG